MAGGVSLTLRSAAASSSSSSPLVSSWNWMTDTRLRLLSVQLSSTLFWSRFSGAETGARGHTHHRATSPSEERVMRTKGKTMAMEMEDEGAGGGSGVAEEDSPRLGEGCWGSR